MGFETTTVTIITKKNTSPFATSIASRNVQLTIVKSNLAKERKISDGKAKVPTNVAIPLDSTFETTLSLPAMYL